jgi:hypothetical protein
MSSADTKSAADRLTLVVCPIACAKPCPACTRDARRFAGELAAILRERHGSSDTADWLDALYPHNP